MKYKIKGIVKEVIGVGGSEFSQKLLNLLKRKEHGPAREYCLDIRSSRLFPTDSNRLQLCSVGQIT
jgi:hypothetical protein